MEHSSITQNRKSRRSNVLLAATLEVGGTSLPVKLRNLSSEGALVQAARLPQTGDAVVFCRNDLAIPSRVAWVDGAHAGIAFAQPLKPEEVLRNVPSPRPPVAISHRRPGFKVQLSEQEKRMLERWL